MTAFKAEWEAFDNKLLGADSKTRLAFESAFYSGGLAMMTLLAEAGVIGGDKERVIALAKEISFRWNNSKLAPGDV